MTADRRQSTLNVEKSSRSSISGSSSYSQAAHNSVSQSVSRSHRRGKADHRRAQQMMDRDKASDSLIKVLDPDTKEDRTPLSLLRTHPKSKAGDKSVSKKPGESAMSESQFSEFEGNEDRSFSRIGESTESDSITTKSISLSMSEGDDGGVEPLAMDGESTETSSIDSRQIEVEPVSRKKRKDSRDMSDDEDEKPKEKKEMTYEERKSWLQAPCTITLTETGTFFLIENEDSQIATDSEEAAAVTERNEIYTDLVTKKEATRYAERSAQTFNNPHKNKETQFTRCEHHKVGVGVTTWEIYDTMRRLDDEDSDGEHAGQDAEAKPGDGDGDEMGEMDDETNAFLDAMGGDDDGGGDNKGSAKTKRNAWMLSPSLDNALMIVERMVVQNIWQAEQLVYRNISIESGEDKTAGTTKEKSPLTRKKERDTEEKEEEEEPDEDKADPSTMKVLWRYGCHVVENQNVSCFGWNKTNTDILAVGYGDYSTNTNANNKGYVCCWSLKNPVYPERTFKVDTAGVSSVDFSFNHPSLLAVGHTDGALALFDVRQQGDTPILKSTVSGGQHTGTIWQVKWVLKGKDRGESLVSISADGRVTDWSIKKGLECTNLLRLKRMPNKSQGASQSVKGDALLSRQSGGMCVDFNPNEKILYIVGTEDGTIHKCSTSYNEQYLETYAGHAGPVYRCKWSPFCSEIFLTCSADWTAKMWRQDRLDPIITFQSLPDAVHDVCWSPTVSTLFGTITSTGRIDMWDLMNPIEPKTWLELEGRSLNCLSFAEQGSPVVVVGDNRGEVTVLKLNGTDYETPPGDAGTQEAQEEKLLKYLKKNIQ